MGTLQPVSDFLEQLFEGRASAIARDLKLNLRKLLSDGALDPEEAAATLVALCASTGHRRLGDYARAWMASTGASAEQVCEAEEAAAMMAMLNTYYSFRDKLGDERLGAAGLRMTAMARPVLGKIRWEQLAFALSVLNGCQPCIRFHAVQLRVLGTPEAKLHDLGRLAAVSLATSRFFAVSPPDVSLP